MREKREKASRQREIEAARVLTWPRIEIMQKKPPAIGAGGTENLTQLCKMTIVPASVHEVRTPLDGILNPFRPSVIGPHQAAWSVSHQSTNLSLLHSAPLANSVLESRASEMFLRPAQLLKREKVHGIVVDFVDNIVPRQDNRTISEGGSTKLVVSYGPKKSRLEQVTLSHNRPKNLKSQEDINNHLAYTVKIRNLKQGRRRRERCLNILFPASL